MIEYVMCSTVKQDPKEFSYVSAHVLGLRVAHLSVNTLSCLSVLYHLHYRYRFVAILLYYTFTIAIYIVEEA